MQEDLKRIEEKLDVLLQAQRQVFTSKEAASFLRISRDVLLRETRIGNVRYSKNGANNLYQKADLLDWLERTRGYEKTLQNTRR